MQPEGINSSRTTRFRQRRRKWLHWLHEDEVHGIWPQINQLMWNDTLFRCLLELRKEAQRHVSDVVGFNGHVVRLVDRGFAESQLMRMRRLLDTGNNVISLPRIVRDIRRNSDSITRENYVCQDGRPYDDVAARNAWNLIDNEQERDQVLNQADSWVKAAQAHIQFDALSGVPPKNRHRTDRIQEAVFSALEGQFAEARAIVKHATKYIAHAADAESRRSVERDHPSLTFEQVDKAQRMLVEVAAFITDYLLLDSSGGALAGTAGNHLENLDKPWATAESLQIAYAHWHERAGVIDGWSAPSVEALIQKRPAK